MRKFGIILAVLLFNVSSYAQWKSYYPEGKSFKKEQRKADNEKNKKLFDTHLFNGFKAKSLEDYDEALKYFEKCIKLDRKNPLPFYES